MQSTVTPQWVTYRGKGLDWTGSWPVPISSPLHTGSTKLHHLSGWNRTVEHIFTHIRNAKASAFQPKRNCANLDNKSCVKQCIECCGCLRLLGILLKDEAYYVINCADRFVDLVTFEHVPKVIIYCVMDLNYFLGLFPCGVLANHDPLKTLVWSDQILCWVPTICFTQIQINVWGF